VTARSIMRGPSAERLLGLWVRIPRGGHGCLSVVSVACCQVEVSARGRSLVQRSATEYGVFECDLETSKTRRRRPDMGCCATGKEEIGVKKVIYVKRLHGMCIILTG
jgi:hypothetical protein